MENQQLIENMLERSRLARHAIRKAFEATKAYAAASKTSNLVEEQSRGLQQFVIDQT
jgi:hypothetical protein